MRSDHDDAVPPEGAPPASLRAVAGRWLLDAAADSRVRSQRRRRRRRAHDASRATSSRSPVRSCWSKRPRQPRSRCAVSISSATTPCPRSATACARSRRRPKTCPSISAKSRASTVSLRRAAARSRAATGTTRPGSWVRCSSWCSACSRCWNPSRSTCSPRDASVKSVGSFSWQSASSVFVFPGEHHLRASREGYVPAEANVKVGGPVAAQALIHLVKLPGKLEVDTGGVPAEISADGALLGRVPGTVDAPAGDRTLTFKARAPSRSRGAPHHRGRRRAPESQGRAEAVFRGGQRELGARGRADRSRRQTRGRHAREGRNGCGHPARAGVRAGTAALDLERRRERRARRRPSGPSSSARRTRESPCARCRPARR